MLIFFLYVVLVLNLFLIQKIIIKKTCLEHENKCLSSIKSFLVFNSENYKQNSPKKLLILLSFKSKYFTYKESVT